MDSFDFDPHLIHMVPWAHMSQPLKRHLDYFSRFCSVHGRDQ